jgi:hypothetical protein
VAATAAGSPTRQRPTAAPTWPRSRSPEAITRLETLGQQLEQRADELGCSDDELMELTCARIGDLKASGDFGRLMLAELASQC